MKKIAIAAAFLMGVSAASAEDPMKSMHHMSDASTAYMDAMKGMDDAMAGMAMTGEPATDFAVMMVPHHQAAVDMAKAYLASGDTDPVLTKLANAIVASQESEIALLNDWIAKHGK